MSKYVLRFWFEHGGICIWGVNGKAKEDYGYAIESNKLSISIELLNILDGLESEYVNCLNWESPMDPAPWTKEDKKKFKVAAIKAYEKLINELGSDFEVINDIDNCLYEDLD